MSVSRNELEAYFSEVLKPQLFKDYAPNGLQVEGKNEINKVLSAVTASQNIIEQCIKEKADALLVHHGFFWPGEPAVITGLRKQRIAKLLAHDINLFAYHLPLDAHLELMRLTAQAFLQYARNHDQYDKFDQQPFHLQQLNLLKPALRMHVSLLPLLVHQLALKRRYTQPYFRVT